MKRSVEQLIIGSAKHGAHNKTFTATVMARLNTQTQPKNEISAALARTMSVNKKETFIMKLRHMPTMALVALSAVALLSVSGVAYAISALWLKPTVTTEAPVKNQYNRLEIAALLKGCGDQHQAASYEIKQGSTLAVGEVEKILQAQCERTAINQWMTRSLPQPSKDLPKDGDIREEYWLSSVASKIDALDKTHISLSGDAYNSPKAPLALASNAKFIVNGQEASSNDIKAGDTVFYITYEKTQQAVHVKTPTNSEVEQKMLESKVTHLVKVDLPLEYYGPSKQNQIAKREACRGNAQDSCVEAAMIDLYEASYHPSAADLNRVAYKHIQGVMTEVKPGSIHLQTSSGRTFTLQLPGDIIAEFNTQRAGNYENNLQVSKGDMLDIYYLEANNQHTTTLTSEHVQKVAFLLNSIQKSDAPKKY